MTQEQQLPLNGPATSPEAADDTAAMKALVAQTAHWFVLLNGCVMNATHTNFPAEEKRDIAEHLSTAAGILKTQLGQK